MKILLGSQDIWDIVESGYKELTDDANQTVAQITVLKKTRVKDKSTLYFLYNVVDESGFKKIANVASSKEAWDILEVSYRGNDWVRQVQFQAAWVEKEKNRMYKLELSILQKMCLKYNKFWRCGICSERCGGE